MSRASLILIALCALLPSLTASARIPNQAEIAGRWRGHNFSPGKCSDKGCQLTYDIVACGEAWCGVEVGEDDACKATTLTLVSGIAQYDAEFRYEGRIHPAPGSEPYVVKVELTESREEAGGLLITIAGASEALFPLLSRDFPYTALLARTGDAVCKADKPVS